MRLLFTPTAIASAALLAMASYASAQDASAPAAGPEATGVVMVDKIDFSKPVTDPLSNYMWMVGEVDFTFRSNPEGDAPNPKWVNNVAVTLTLGWGKPGEIDLAVSTTATLLSVEVGKKNAVFFMVPPEVLQPGLNGSGTPVSARNAPTFYVASFKAGDTSIEPDARSVSVATLNNRTAIDAFLQHAQDQVSKNPGGLLTGTTAPFYIYSLALGVTLTNSPRAGGVLPTLVNSTSGH
jgi:hypothetical protein